MKLALPQEVQNFIEEKVRVGEYPTPEAVVADAIARLQQESEDVLDDQTLAAIANADAEFDRGDDRPFEEVARELKKKYLGT